MRDWQSRALAGLRLGVTMLAIVVWALVMIWAMLYGLQNGSWFGIAAAGSMLVLAPVLASVAPDGWWRSLG